jgi:pimeloyl-ACP methyl ester carboxylesterase
LGSRVGFWLAVHHPERFSSFILAGMTPYNIPEATLKMVDDITEGLRLLKSDPDAYFIRQEGIFKRALSLEEKERFLAQDSDALIAVWTAWATSPALSDKDLAGISLPCIVFCGELDEGGFFPGAKEGASLIPNAKFFSFPELNHYQAGARSDLVLPYLNEFLAQVSKK